MIIKIILFLTVRALLYSFLFIFIFEVIFEIYILNTLPVGSKNIIIHTIILFFLIISFFITCFSNPGIVVKKKFHEKKIKEKYSDLTMFVYCQKCHIYIPKFMHSEHCDSCGICFENQSHHSFIFSKCIGKYNHFIYISFLSLFIVYVTRTLLLILIVTVYKLIMAIRSLL